MLFDGIISGFFKGLGVKAGRKIFNDPEIKAQLKSINKQADKLGWSDEKKRRILGHD
ncbi:MAG: hypothetical protein PF570_04340 [Candidatus Cloacimonetes bacterium]|jgi:hypothetical protein|nr:hypothetical protein [Candidatus Cloacimonadota bacterium]